MHLLQWLMPVSKQRLALVRSMACQFSALLPASLALADTSKMNCLSERQPASCKASQRLLMRRDGDLLMIFTRMERSMSSVKQFCLSLDRIDDATKPIIVGHLMAAHVEGNLTYDEAIRLAAMVNRCYAPDLDYLINFKSGTQREMQAIADALFSTGLLRNCGLDGGTIDDALSGGTIYEINRYGELLIKYGLVPSSYSHSA